MPPLLEFPVPVVLASASPRRRELLATLIETFEVVPAEVDEEALSSADPWRTATDLARAKADAVAMGRSEAVIIGADTVVALPDPDWVQLGKPRDAEVAAAMLRRLSGRTHAVITGVAILAPKRRETFFETSHVTFRALEEAEIRAYAASGEPLDKAGGYAIQGGAAGFVERREGSLTNVIGLPIETLEETLHRNLIRG